MYTRRTGLARYAPRASRPEIPEIVFQSLSVVLPRLAINARRRRPLNFEVGVPQTIDIVDMVQKRGESLFPVLFCR
jgi:hypothetical protein